MPRQRTGKVAPVFPQVAKIVARAGHARRLAQGGFKAGGRFVQIVLILSDGLDSGDARVLGAEVAKIEHRAARVIWLNPLLGDVGYRPVARTMRAALAHVDVFASAHNLESLQALGRELTL